MEMVPLSSARERQRRQLSRAIRRTDPAVSDPLLADENTQYYSRRARPTFGDPYNMPLATPSSYSPPEPIGVNIITQTNPLDDHLFFTAPPSRSLRRRRHPLRHHDNPAVDLGGFLSHGCCCMQCVRTQEVGIIENFGQFQEILPPGFYCLPWPLTNISGRLSLRIQQLDVVCETKTQDNGA